MAKVYGQNFFGSGKYEIGDDCFISVQCLFDGSDNITIGDNVYLAMRVVPALVTEPA